MKRKVAFLLWALLILSGCGGAGSVIEYNDSFVAVVKECTDSTQDLFNLYQAEDSTLDSIIEALEKSIEICENSESKASKMWDFEKDSSLKDAVVDLLSTEVDYLSQFKSTSRFRNTDNLTEEDKEAYNWVVSELYQSEDLLNSKFASLQSIQEAFAAKHGLKLDTL